MSQLTHFLSTLLDHKPRFSSSDKKHIWGNMEFKDWNLALQIHKDVMNNCVYFSLVRMDIAERYNIPSVFKGGFEEVLPVLREFQKLKNNVNALPHFKTLRQRYSEKKQNDIQYKNSQILKQFDLILMDQAVEKDFSYQFEREYKGKVGFLKLTDNQTGLIHELDLDQLETMIFSENKIDSIKINVKINYEKEVSFNHILEIPNYEFHFYPLIDCLCQENLQRVKDLKEIEKNKNKDQEIEEEEIKPKKVIKIPTFIEWNKTIEHNFNFYNRAFLDLLFKSQLEYTLEYKENVMKKKI